MIVTTSGKEKEVSRAKKVAEDLNVPFVKRNKRSINKMHEEFESDIFVVSKEGHSIYIKNNSEPIFFHPNLAMVRMKRYLKGEFIPFLQAAKLKEGMSVLDCTLGLASDAIIASAAIGSSGKIVGIEVNPFLAYLVKEGLINYSTELTSMREAMMRIEVEAVDHLTYLKSQKSNSFDVIYFDPMFETSIENSDGIHALKLVASYQDINHEIINEAKRVARKRIVLKDHWRSSRFNEYGFHVFKRKTAQYHFGSLQLD
jgi:16S rRNA G966 N2-methylase RsmD